ncbi:GlxA family transcriptional regulator [Marinomonas ushuaiensis]|uniref:GlxA family transcriptional regulator n=1 Tax=Marinomonas ushuaiensis TaxID=263818 RepID=UPI0004B3CEF6|nr:GlxA family transcriptional regulator [Marinomonas ushuaiensis]
MNGYSQTGPLIADDDGVLTLSFLLLPEYSMMSLLSITEPLRIANRIVGKEVFRWQCLSENGNPVIASNDMALEQSIHVDFCPSPKNVFVNASFRPEKYISETCIKWLRNLDRKKSVIGAIDTGCYALAKAKLLDGYKVTLHWEAKPAFQERYPYLNVSDELFKIDGNRITCAGGIAASDMVLYFIEYYCQSEVADLVCEQLITNGTRHHADRQRPSKSEKLNVYHPKVLKALELMDANIETPLATVHIAKVLSISIRQLERLFLQYLKVSPSAYYLKLRMEYAHYLLSDSGLSITEIALASGFSSTAHFSRRYRAFYGKTATQYRLLTLA